MRIAVKKIMRKHRYPPDMETRATETVLEQDKLLADLFSDSKMYDLDRVQAQGMAAEGEE